MGGWPSIFHMCMKFVSLFGGVSFAFALGA